MRRWVLIIMLLVYPFQVALAMADQCCVTTPAGLSHHATAQGGSLETAQSVVLDDDAAPGRADPHCPACVFGQIASVPTKPGLPSAVAPHGVAITSITPFLTCVPRIRPERPNWPAAAT
jgi:hypothetical protein